MMVEIPTQFGPRIESIVEYCIDVAVQELRPKRGGLGTVYARSIINLGGRRFQVSHQVGK